MRYIPGNVNPADMATFLRQELDKIAQAIESQSESLSLKTLHAAPTKYRDGTIVKADGTDWSPGGLGAGVYCYYGGAWNKLG